MAVTERLTALPAMPASPARSATGAPPPSLFERRVRKLLRSPYRFFRDPLVRRWRRWQSPAAALVAVPVPVADPAVGKRTAKARRAGPDAAATAPPLEAAVAEEVVTAPEASDPLGPWTLPSFLQAHPGPAFEAAMAADGPVYLYLPWIREHSEALMRRLQSPADYRIVALDLFRDLDEGDTRREIGRYAREQPHRYRRVVARRLAPLRGRVTAVLFSFDWAPVMRIVANVCEELGLRRILIPHESVFVDRQKYYWDLTAQAAVPAADLVLCWGELQREIFAERGYPADRLRVVGAPKFDTYVAPQPALDRRQFHRLFGLDPQRRTVLFATQPLDSQLNARQARETQARAIEDLLEVTREQGAQLIVRLPPSREEVLGPALRLLLQAADHVALDDAACYLVPAEEAVWHCDLVCSINSTMLFEATLAGRAALSLRYLEFDALWDRVGIPAVRDRDALARELPRLLDGWTPPAEGLAWAARMYSVGRFDGRAAERIRSVLRQVVQEPASCPRRADPIQRVLEGRGDALDVVGLHSPTHLDQGTQRYLLPMLRARTRVEAAGGVDSLRTLASVDLFVQWGVTPSQSKARQDQARRLLGRQTLIVEDGFLRSIDIGLSGEPGLSITVDDTTAYYDATRASYMQRRLESGPALTAAERQRARAAIDSIVRQRVSKYNHAPNVPLAIGRPGHRKILLVDQRYGDQSVASGLADERSFERMLTDAMRLHPDADLIVKQHPDAIQGGKSSYYSNERMAFARYAKHVHPIRFDVNPHVLFDLVDEVWVVTSGMGFEALMAGKAVTCYGMPFYAGWGATTDRLPAPPGRTRRRDVEEIFHVAYIDCSRYYDPDQGAAAEIEDVIAHIVRRRGW